MAYSLRHSFLRHVAQTSPQPDGFEVSRGEGIYLFDQDGRPYIDCISGIAVSSFGHHHPHIDLAIRTQLEHHLHTMVYGEHIQVPQVRLAERLASLLPADLSCTYFTNSGAEAVEGAIKLARKYTGRYEIIACRRGYHGSTLGAESLRSDLIHTQSVMPLVPGIRHIDFNAIADVSIITDRTAAIILEPIQGEAGVILPDHGYLALIRQKCSSTGTLLILDEIQTGMGRTGSLFAFQAENMVPDILLTAKAFGGGLPLGAFISRPNVMAVLSHDPILGHMTTFGGHPLSCAASLAAFDLLERENLAASAARTGNLIKSSLESHPAIREIRHRGLMMGIDLKNPDHLMRAVKACRNQGLLLDWFLFNNRTLRLAPPLILSTEEALLLCGRIALALDSL